jgi:hypothetical protein
MDQYRQGDVLLVKVERQAGSLKPVPREKGRVVLAHGEATGHAHSLRSGKLLMDLATGRRYLRLLKGAVLEHQEHAPIELEPGDYEVVRQREYSPEAIRYVAD